MHTCTEGVLYYTTERGGGGGLAGDQSGDTPCHGVMAGETVKQGCDGSEASPSFQAVSRCPFTPTPLKEVGLCGTASRLIQPLLLTHSFGGQSSKISQPGLHISSFQLLQGNRQFADAGTGEYRYRYRGQNNPSSHGHLSALLGTTFFSFSSAVLICITSIFSVFY